MPYKCCVPQCRGNYDSTRKVRVFRFPHDEELCRKWVRAVPRENFSPTQYSRVCELHFQPEDIMYETSYVDDRTGRTVTAPLPSSCIRPGAVPSKFPACPSYFSKESTSRESPDSKRKRFEAEALQAAIAESTETSLREEEADRIACIRDLACHLRNQDSTFWHIIENKERLVIVHIVEDEAPWIKYSLVVKADMGTTFHFMKKPTTTLGRDLCVPATAESKRAVMKFLDGVQAWDSNTDSPSKEHTEDIIEAICFLLSALPLGQEDNAGAIRFLTEQLRLLSKNKTRRRYSPEFTVFSCLLYTISPHAYKYMRSYGYAAYAALKKLKCDRCREALTLNKEISVSVADKHYDLIRSMDRGGLVHPAMSVVNAVAHNYAVVEQLSQNEVFLKLSNQRQVVTNLTVELLTNDESSDFDTCDDGHTSEAILRRALGSGASCLGLMKKGVDNVAFFLSSLGKLHTLGVQLDLAPLYPPVPWPLPRGTPNIGHLVSWDHSQQWNVVSWSDFPTLSQVSEEVIEVDLESNEGDAYIAGHQLDGRVHLLLLHLGLLYRWNISALSVFNGSHYRMARTQMRLLPGIAGSVKFLVNIMRASGEFEVCEAGTVAASGRIRTAEKGEKLLEKEPPGPPAEAVTYELEADDIYKELRLRGYEYHGSFRGIIKADLNTRQYGKLNWADNWVTFIDTMLQFSILGNPVRTLRLPVRIQSCRVDPEVHAKIYEKAGDAGIDVVYNPYLNTCLAGGVAITGLKASIAPRRAVQQTPLLEDYQFVSYVDDEKASSQRESQIREYVEVCCGVARRVLESCGKNKAQISDVMNGFREAPEQVLNRYLENPGDNHGLLKVLATIQKQTDGSAASLVATVQSALAAHQEDLDRDFLNTVLYAEDPLRHLLDVVVENTSTKKIRVLELADGGSTLLAPWVTDLLRLSNILLKTDYTVAHPAPDKIAAELLPEGTKTIKWDCTSTSKDGLPEAELIVLRSVILTSGRSLDSEAEKINSLCKENGFVLLAQRTALTPAEMFLSTISKVPLRFHTRKTLEAAFLARGFRVVGLKSNNVCTLLLLRKSVPVDVTKQEVIRVKNTGYDWVEPLKTKIAELENRPTGENVWLFGEDANISGVVGLTNCLRQESGTHVRCILNASVKVSNKVTDFRPSNPEYKEILEKNLVMNVYRDGQWGSYRHIVTQSHGPPKVTTPYAFLNVQTRGDLSSLQWYESPLRYASPLTSVNSVLCSVYYAPLNFRDIMLATGKLPPDALPGNLATSDCVLGLEFSGRDPHGRRVMGSVASQGMATAVNADPGFLWEVPESWSLEEASTVPVAYSTAYYALVVRGNMRPGESLLVHSGSGGVGQAAISIALSMGCTVFTTVGRCRMQ
ncbi:hypothetical protein HPB51_026667 [Rhipicephalus microplus]|uniref:THAP-type domain-containing protein n=1 Tax=Rhipicephalus microplus TaxID=6941 RepID=A0A9J6D243_RHIMP|nr:hypothetical protein HPB51_026667 [Rhipicephalus microplus]